LGASLGDAVPVRPVVTPRGALSLGFRERFCGVRDLVLGAMLYRELDPVRPVVTPGMISLGTTIFRCDEPYPVLGPIW
jgi:hypothetical protein